MAIIRAFKGLRPNTKFVEDVAELPYDVLNSSEAKVIAEGNDKSFFHVTKPEIDFDDNVDPYHKDIYNAGRKNLDSFIKEKILIQDEKPNLYLYTQIMNGHPQTGLVACVSIDDYINSVVKKHEYTREDKEKDRTTHLDILNANTGPVFLLYKEDGSKDALFTEAMKNEPVYDFTAKDGVRHIVRIIDDENLQLSLIESFKDDILYIADGHHRAASAVKVGQNRRKENPDYTGDEEYNFFLTVLFPHNQLNILAYNRAVRDFNNISADEFLEKLSIDFSVEKTGIKVPEKVQEFSMYCQGEWYTLKPKFDISNDPIKSLDVSILQESVLNSILGISDPRTDKRIDFIGGIRGTDELERLVDSGDYVVAFSMFPTTVNQLMDVSDKDGIMPPKSTWFEPKLRSGLLVHSLS